ncbi:MAG: hypothetical protein R6W93_12005 [Candidatus Limnocylindrales bacterium]|jgi:hypothetical protein
MSGPMNESPNAPPEEPQSQPTQPTTPAGPSQAAQATAVAGAAVSAVRERLIAGEQLVLAAAGAIVVVYLLFQFLLDYRIFASDFTVVLAALTVLAIWIHRWGHYDFGSGYRILIGALGVSLAILALMSLLAWARVGGNSADFLHLIGRLLYWASGVAAFVGAWQVFRTREV